MSDEVKFTPCSFTVTMLLPETEDNPIVSSEVQEAITEKLEVEFDSAKLVDVKVRYRCTDLDSRYRYELGLDEIEDAADELEELAADSALMLQNAHPGLVLIQKGASFLRGVMTVIAQQVKMQGAVAGIGSNFLESLANMGACGGMITAENIYQLPDHMLQQIAEHEFIKSKGALDKPPEDREGLVQWLQQLLGQREERKIN